MMSIAKANIVAQYNAARQAVFDHVGYVEDWAVLPIDDRREYYWWLDGEGPGDVHYSTAHPYSGRKGEEYMDTIYTQRHLPRWVYRGPDYTMVVVDTHTDGNKFLAVFDNDMEVHG